MTTAEKIADAIDAENNRRYQAHGFALHRTEVAELIEPLLAEHEAELRNLLHARIIGVVTPITGGHEVRIVCNSEQHAERICEILGDWRGCAGSQTNSAG